MPRVCKVCTHAEHTEIDKRIAEGCALSEISALFRVSPDALQRHKDRHLPELLTKAKDAADAADADNLLTRLEELTRSARDIKDKAESSGDYRAALNGIRELVRIVELIAKLRGKLDESPKVNITISSEWVTLRTVILQTLEPYPDARRAVVDALTYATRE